MKPRSSSGYKPINQRMKQNTQSTTSLNKVPSQNEKQSAVLRPSASAFKIGLDEVRNKRLEVSSFLDESSFVHSYLCGATSS